MAFFRGGYRLAALGATSLIGCGVGIVFSSNGNKSTNVMSWGSSGYGQLGLGDEKDATIPNKVKQFRNGNVVQVAAFGCSSACLTSDGCVYTFGSGADGRLGHGINLDAANQPLPRLLSSSQGLGVIRVALGEAHGAAILADGGLVTWGKGSTGQLGRGKNKDSVVMAVEGLPTAAVAVDCGNKHTAVVGGNGCLYTFGAGYDGALGSGGKKNQPEPVAVEGVQGCVAVACGKDYTLALEEGGRVLAFGADDYGQLGVGGGVRFQRSPRELTALAGQNVVQLAAGEYHAVAITGDGDAFSWGANSDGQLGHGHRNNLSLPRKLQRPEGVAFKSASCGGGHTALLDTKGGLWVVGRGRSGQLGRSDKLEAVAAYRTDLLPVEAIKEPVLAVACGADHTLALTSAKV